MKTRAFISVDIPENIKKEITRIQKKLPEFKGKLTETGNLHLTLKFLGWIDEEKLNEVKKSLRKIRPKGFETEIKQLGFFYPRVVWLHMTGASSLQKEIDDTLSSVFEKEKRFMSHLTIARIKEIDDGKKFREALGKINIKKIKFKVSNFRLKKAILRRTGPIYETLEEYDLED